MSPEEHKETARCAILSIALILLVLFAAPVGIWLVMDWWKYWLN